MDYVLRRLPKPDDRERLELIAEGAQVPYHTLLKIAKGETTDPKASTLERLLRYFKAQGRRKGIRIA